ncbi:MAG: hypothetical protein IPI66_03385 [Chitinophagaceae bacterium]|nr:hypothetical protein [Chitinophagaceae bacterium]
MGTPWEVIIKEYRNELSEKHFSKLDEYKSDFIKYLHSKSFFCDIQQHKKNLHFFILTFLEALWKDVIREEQKNLKNWGPDAGNNLGLAVVKKIMKALTNFETNTDYSEEFSDFTFEEFEKLGYTGLQQAIQTNFTQKGIPIPDHVIPDLKRLIFFMLKAKKVNGFFSGLVFTGYGTEEIFPSILPIQISLALNNRLRWFSDVDNNGIISHEMSSAIRPFAQTDVIDTILSGIDPGLFRLFTQQFEHFIVNNNDTISKIIDKTDHGLAETIRKLDIKQIVQPFIQSINAELKRNYINPMMGAINTLSKEDLAEMSESLIYLTYLKRRFTFAEESVGGPVDVAVITKGDGFIWIKRKHYFKKELNEHYFKNL